MATIDDLPLKNGWFWVLFKGYDRPKPCWFVRNNNDIEESCFLQGGLGDTSSMGVYIDEIEKIGPEINEPEF